MCGVDFTRENELLREYRAELETAEARLRDAQTEADALRQIVAGIELRVSRLTPEPPDESAQPDVSAAGMVAEAKGPWSPPPPRRRRGLKRVLRSVMADSVPRTVDEVAEALAAHELFRGEPPVRASLQNRLWELEAKEGYLTREGDSYVLASTSDTASNGAGGAGTDETEPDSGVIPDTGAGLGDGPDGGPTSSPPSGAQMQYGGGSAEVASRY